MATTKVKSKKKPATPKRKSTECNLVLVSKEGSVKSVIAVPGNMTDKDFGYGVATLGTIHLSSKSQKILNEANNIAYMYNRKLLLISAAIIVLTTATSIGLVVGLVQSAS